MQTGRIYMETKFLSSKGNSSKKTEGKRKQQENGPRIGTRQEYRGSTVKELLPETGRTHPYPLPTPEQRPHGRSSLPSLTHATTPLRSTPFLSVPHPPLPPLHPRQPAVSPSQFTSNTMAGGSRTVVKRTKDAALEHVRKAPRNDGSLLT
jgi:hypothetical protein